MLPPFGLRVKMASSKQDVPFKVIVLDKEIIVLVDDTPNSLSISNSSQLLNEEAPAYTPIIEFPHELVNLLPATIFKWISDADNPKTLDSYDPDIKIILESKQALNDEVISQWKLSNPGKDCPTCILGSVNRRLILKLLPFIYKDSADTILDLIDLLVNYINKGISDQKLYELSPGFNPLRLDPSIKMLESFNNELLSAKKSKGCTQCNLNSIKLKYNNLIKNLLTNILKQS